MVALCMWLRTPALTGPMLRVNCPTFRSLTKPPLPHFSPLPANTRKYYNIDDIDMPVSSSVGLRYKVHFAKIF